jgi:hypothetical protein
MQKLAGAWNGYGVAAGFLDGPEARLAVEFYKSVFNGRSTVEPESAALRNANVTLTDHSLGSGWQSQEKE